MLLLGIVTMLFLSACASKTVPETDISNAKMALIKAQESGATTYAKDALEKIQKKYQHLQELLKKRRYDEAKFLAQEIQADARLLEKESHTRQLEEKVKKLQGEINLLTHEFTEIKE